MEDTTDERRPCCATTGKAFKSQFKWRNLGFSSPNYRLFPFAQWIWMDGVFYSLYRFLISIGLLVWACIEIPLEVKRSQEEKIKLYYFLYATNWGFLMYMVSSNAFAIFATYFNCKKGEQLVMYSLSQAHCFENSEPHSKDSEKKASAVEPSPSPLFLLHKEFYHV
ncbi:hypothetical protein TSMEX_000150 [Taenia solium]|eukprot:TsM_000164000 transcript=TsM_000164000 gene=TsM_000164000